MSLYKRVFPKWGEIWRAGEDAMGHGDDAMEE